MDDIDKTRVQHVLFLEEQIRHLQRQLDEAKPLAEKWTPQVASEMDVVTRDVRITLAFGGKRATAVVVASDFTNNTLPDLVYSIASIFTEGFVMDRLVEVIKPEVDRIMRGSQAAAGAGKW